jgi:hypothetical protein
MSKRHKRSNREPKKPKQDRTKAAGGGVSAVVTGWSTVDQLHSTDAGKKKW